MKFPLNIPSITNLEKKYVNNVLNTGWLSSGGIHTKIFEKKFSNIVECKYSLAVQSGTAALHVALKALGVNNGDYVIIPNYSCVSTISAVSQCGGIPVILDVELESFGLDIKSLIVAIKKYKPKVLQLVHVYGFPAKYTLQIKNICKKYKVYLLEDASEALGGKINRKAIGSFGDISIFSIRSEKMIGVGEGGVVCSNNKTLFERTRILASRSSPFRRKKDSYWKKYLALGEGYNYLIPHLLGAFGRAQIERFPYILKKKINVGKLYRKIFLSNNISFQKIEKKTTPVFWLNAIYFKGLKKERIRFIGKFLETRGVEVRSGFWPLSKNKGFKKIIFGSQKNSIKLFNNLLVLPSHLHLTIKDIKFIHSLLKKYLTVIS
jgi:perosamine synthetase